MFAELIGWGRAKETDTDLLVKVRCRLQTWREMEGRTAQEDVMGAEGERGRRQVVLRDAGRVSEGAKEARERVGFC